MNETSTFQQRHVPSAKNHPQTPSELRTSSTPSVKCASWSRSNPHKTNVPQPFCHPMEASEPHCLSHPFFFSESSSANHPITNSVSEFHTHPQRLERATPD